MKNFSSRKTHTKRHLEARTQLTYDLLMQYGTGKSGIPSDIALEYSVKNLEN